MRRPCLAYTLGLAMLVLPSQVMAGDTEIAQKIVNVMERTGALEGNDISVRFSNGTAYLRGTVQDEEHMETAIQIAQASPDVERVINELKITESSRSRLQLAAMTQAPTAPASSQPAVRQAPESPGYIQAQTAPAPTAAPRSQATGSDRPMPVPMAASTVGRQPQPNARLAQAPPARLNHGPAAPVSGMPHPAYVPGVGGGAARAAYDQPAMPGYAWPSYAAYPNYAALTYPKQYSPTAWPYIGPFYPYPQVPLGWRKVTLQWDDGWWFLDFKD